jgi:hypothetical protein
MEAGEIATGARNRRLRNERNEDQTETRVLEESEA